MTRDGYPEEHELRYIEEYDLIKNSAVTLIEYVRDLWKYEDYFTAEEDGEGLLKLEMHTGGWSGNEDIIEALRKNPLFFALYWQSTFRGGHYYFEVELAERPEMMWKKRAREIEDSNPAGFWDRYCPGRKELVLTAVISLSIAVAIAIYWLRTTGVPS